MAVKVSNTAIGAFVLASVALGAVAIALFGRGSFRKNTFVLAFQFQGDVSGLSVGAPVTIKGFKIGSVKDLALDYDLETGEFRTTALADMAPTLLATGDKFRSPHLLERDTRASQRERVLREMVADGARAQLGLQSFVTGLLQIDIDFPEKVEPAELEQTFEGHWQFPTQPSDLELLQRTLLDLPLREAVEQAIVTMKSFDELARSEDLRRGLAGVDEVVGGVQELTKKLDTRLATLDGQLTTLADALKLLLEQSSSAVTTLQAETSETLAGIRDLTENIDSRVTPTADSLDEVLESARASFDHTRTLLASLSGLTPSDVSIVYQVSTTLDAVTRAMDSLRLLSNFIEQHPEALLRGK